MGSFWKRESRIFAEVTPTLLKEELVDDGASYLIGFLYSDKRPSIDYQFINKHEAVEAYNKVALHFTAFCNSVPEQNRKTLDIFFLIVPHGSKLDDLYLELTNDSIIKAIWKNYEPEKSYVKPNITFIQSTLGHALLFN